MAEIRILPVQLCGSDQANRLHADLAAAHARGEDLGSRAPHLQAGGERLLELTRALERALKDLDLTLIKLGLRDADTRDALQSFASAAQGLADTAQRYPSGL